VKREESEGCFLLRSFVAGLSRGVLRRAEWV
jgi:hypothetical protein